MVASRTARELLFVLVFVLVFVFVLALRMIDNYNITIRSLTPPNYGEPSANAAPEFWAQQPRWGSDRRAPFSNR